MNSAENEPAGEIEVELRARLFALRFAVSFLMSQTVFRDAHERGVSATSLVADFKSNFVGLIAEARYPPAFKTQMTEELAAIADQLLENARTFDELGKPTT